MRTVRSGRVFLVALLPVLLGSCEDLPDPPNLPPAASFFFTPVAPIIAGQTSVAFNAEGSRDSDGTIVGYAWNWGDGTPPQAADNPRMTHVFPDQPNLRCVEARYAVQLTVTDDKGASSTATEQVTVVESPPPDSVQCR